MIGYIIFSLICELCLFLLLVTKIKKLEDCESMLRITEQSNEIYNERLETLKAKQLHLNYLIAEKNEELDKLRKEVIELNVKLSNKKKRK